MNRALLEYEMKRRGISAETLSRKIGMNRSTFSKKCNGKSDFTVGEVRKIMTVLNLDDPKPIFFAW